MKLLRKTKWYQNLRKKFVGHLYDDVVAEQREIREREIARIEELRVTEDRLRREEFAMIRNSDLEEYQRKLASVQQSVEVEKRELRKEIEEYIKKQNRTVDAENKFAVHTLAMQELVYGVRRMIRHISDLVVAESDISDLLQKLEIEEKKSYSEQEKLDLLRQKLEEGLPKT